MRSLVTSVLLAATAGMVGAGAVVGFEVTSRGAIAVHFEVLDLALGLEWV